MQTDTPRATKLADSTNHTQQQRNQQALQRGVCRFTMGGGEWGGVGGEGECTKRKVPQLPIVVCKIREREVAQDSRICSIKRNLKYHNVSNLLNTKSSRAYKKGSASKTNRDNLKLPCVCALLCLCCYHLPKSCECEH